MAESDSGRRSSGKSREDKQTLRLIVGGELYELPIPKIVGWHDGSAPSDMFFLQNRPPNQGRPVQSCKSADQRDPFLGLRLGFGSRLDRKLEHHCFLILPLCHQSSRVGEVRFGEALVGAARIDHNAHTGPVDRADRHADRAKKPLRTAIPTLTGADCLNAKSISLSANIGHGRRGRY
jgi:hypothetical protein